MLIQFGYDGVGRMRYDGAKYAGNITGGKRNNQLFAFSAVCSRFWNDVSKFREKKKSRLRKKNRRRKILVLDNALEVELRFVQTSARLTCTIIRRLFRNKQTSSSCRVFVDTTVGLNFCKNRSYLRFGILLVTLHVMCPQILVEFVYEPTSNNTCISYIMLEYASQTQLSSIWCTLADSIGLRPISAKNSAEADAARYTHVR